MKQLNALDIRCDYAKALILGVIGDADAAEVASGKSINKAEQLAEQNYERGLPYSMPPYFTGVQILIAAYRNSWFDCIESDPHN